MQSLRIGQGWDLHRLGAKDRALILAGVEILSSGGPIAHSDGDVLLHALIDAILGALGEGDIGQWFPDGDAKYKGCCSQRLLQIVLEQMRGKSYEIINIDLTCFLESPKLAPFSNAMIESLSRACAIPRECINVKAKTAEGLGAVGKGQAIAASAVVLLHKL